MAIDKVTGKAWADLSEINNVAKANIAKVAGQGAPSGGGGDISFDDITVTLDEGSISTVAPHTANLPSTASSGDLVIMLWVMDDPTSGIGQTPTGWTLANTTTWGDNSSDAHVLIFYRTLDGTEGSTVDCYTSISTIRYSVFWTMVGTNVDQSNPVDAVGSPVMVDKTSSVTVPAVTSVDGGTFMVIIGFDQNDGEPFTFSNSSFTFDAEYNEDSPDGGSAYGVSAGWAHANIGATTSTNTTSVTCQKSDGKVVGHIVWKKA